MLVLGMIIKVPFSIFILFFKYLTASIPAISFPCVPAKIIIIGLLIEVCIIYAGVSLSVPVQIYSIEVDDGKAIWGKQINININAMNITLKNLFLDINLKFTLFYNCISILAYSV
ncbi:unnamed protein product [marine sediment metagenome]|uniref:Uncharacterized protein n=1 Tax=marine sediment metagenome TaxID=412755 RepID=X1KXX5_9ZZZZ